jgi:hypothetical protein
MHRQQSISDGAARNRRKFLSAILILSAALLTACAAVIHNVAVSQLPTYSATAAAWGKPAPGQGRVVVLYPKLPLAGVGGPLSGAGGGEGLVRLNVDDTYTTIVADEVFVFIDLPAGPHTASTKLFGAGLLMDAADEPKKISFSLAPGETKYLKVVSVQYARGAPEILRQGEAESLLAAIRHKFATPLAFDKQNEPPPPAFHI